MYPEAGGSSSFARHAFNEFWSFFAAWGQMLNYVITIAISAFFVPHYIGGLFWEHAAPRARRHHLRNRRGRRPVPAQRRRRQGGGGAQHPPRGHRLRDPAAAGDRRGGAGAVARDAGRQRQPRGRADLEGLPHRDPHRDDRLHGDRDDLQHGRGGQGRAQDDPGGDQPRADRGLRDLLHRCRPSRCRALPVTRADGSARPCSASRRTRAASPATRSSASSRSFDLGPLQGAGEIYVGLLAATILFIATNAGIIGVSRLVYSMGLHRQVPDRLRQLHPQATARRGSGSCCSAPWPA